MAIRKRQSTDQMKALPTYCTTKTIESIRGIAIQSLGSHGSNFGPSQPRKAQWRSHAATQRAKLAPSTSIGQGRANQAWADGLFAMLKSSCALSTGHSQGVELVQKAPMRGLSLISHAARWRASPLGRLKLPP